MCKYLRRILNKIHKEKVNSILVLILIIIAPFATEIIIKYGPYRAKSFNNDTWFSFMGSYIGAVVTLGIMFVTFKKSEKEYKRNLKQQKKQYEIGLQKERLDRIIQVLLLNNYCFCNPYTVLENMDRFMHDIHSVGFTTLKVYAKYSNDRLIDELLDLQKKELEIIRLLERDFQTLEREQRIIKVMEIGLELNIKRDTIIPMYEVYLDKIYKQIYEE